MRTIMPRLLPEGGYAFITSHRRSGMVVVYGPEVGRVEESFAACECLDEDLPPCPLHYPVDYAERRAKHKDQRKWFLITPRQRREALSREIFRLMATCRYPVTAVVCSEEMADDMWWVMRNHPGIHVVVQGDVPLGAISFQTTPYAAQRKD
jgi:hypothetical protein